MAGIGAYTDYGVGIGIAAGAGTVIAGLVCRGVKQKWEVSAPILA